MNLRWRSACVDSLAFALIAILTIIDAANGVINEPKPNLIFILADDLGFAEVGCNGSDAYQTPNIDALAKNGARLSHFYTAPLCGPSRALILTGRYGFRTGAVTQDACGLITRTGEKAEVMLPTILKRAGYFTAMIGKWGQILPSGDAAQWGFDHVMSFKSSGIYWNRSTAKKTALLLSSRGRKRHLRRRTRRAWTLHDQWKNLQPWRSRVPPRSPAQKCARIYRRKHGKGPAVLSLLFSLTRSRPNLADT
jgi:arylsulfatase A-like enzyme